MILQSLVSYYEALRKSGADIPEEGWCIGPVSAALILYPDGTPKEVITQKWEDSSGKKTVLRPRRMLIPEQVVRSSGVSSNFMCDNSTYFFGYDQKNSAQRMKDSHDCCAKLHLQILENVSSPAAKAICGFFEKWKPENFDSLSMSENVREDLMNGANIVFMDEDFHYLHEDSAIQNAWNTDLFA